MACQLIAIDPGSVSGAVAIFFEEDDTIIVDDLRVVDGNVDAAAFSRLLRDMKPKTAVVERVSSMPKQGVASTFRFGVGVGIIQGVIAGSGVPMHLVTPQMWKKGLGLIGKDKEAGRAKAIQLFPGVKGLDRKKDQGRADALLIGHWFRMKLEQAVMKPPPPVLWRPADIGADYD